MKIVLNFILCLSKLIFYNAKYSDSELHNAGYIYNTLKTIIKDVGSSIFASIVTNNTSFMQAAAAWKLLNQDYPQLICLNYNAYIRNFLIKNILKFDWVKKLINYVKQVISFFGDHYIAESILLSYPNTITLV